MKKELLSPAGNMLSLKAAVNAGADAIYIGGKKFGARKFANNFTDEELENAIKYCHLYGVKVYVTVNTIIYENELDECINYISFLHKIGVDALIIQDIGLITIIRKKFPNLEIHASTQCHNYNNYQFKLLEELGVKRVVLAREMELDEIKNIDTSLEKEAFIHGAICISYSGQCLFSSLIMNRSGNRGECAGMCRLPYDLLENNKKINTDKYLLSPKELCTISRFKEIIESDIVSFKIEGRMKSPEYVYLVTKIYRTLIDKYYNNEELEITDSDYKNLKILFNREFTLGHLFNQKDNDLMNIKSPNHIGIEIGKVININKKYITILLDEDIYQEDGIRFISNNKGMIVNFLYDKDLKLINSSKKGTIINIDNRVDLEDKSIVIKTSSNKLVKDLSNILNKKIDISFNVICKLGNKLSIEILDGINKIKEESIVIEKSINVPTTKEDIIEKLSKVNDTPFNIKNINIDMDDNIFIPIKEINILRRKLVDNLISVRENKKIEYIENEYNENYNIKEIDNSIKLSCLVRNEEQLKICINNINGDIYVKDINLYLKYKDTYKNIYYQIPRIDNNKEIYNNYNLLVTDLSNIEKYKNNNLVTDYYLNVVNSKYINYLLNKNINKVTLSPEVNVNSIKDIINKYNYVPNIEVILYSRLELMIMKHNLIKDTNNTYYLLDRNNKKYPVILDNGTNRILHYNNILYNDEETIKLKDIGIYNYRIEFFNENKDEVLEIIKKYKKLLQID